MWPGNVRELKNVIQRAVLVCPGDVLLPGHLPPRLLPRKDMHRQAGITFHVGTTLRDMEREMIARVLSFTRNNRKKSAELLGISRRALYNKISRLDIG